MTLASTGTVAPDPKDLNIPSGVTISLKHFVVNSSEQNSTSLQNQHLPTKAGVQGCHLLQDLSRQIFSRTSHPSAPFPDVGPGCLLHKTSSKTSWTLTPTSLGEVREGSQIFSKLSVPQ